MTNMIDYQTVCNFGALLHRSQMFNTRSEYEAAIIAAMCFQEGISFLQFRRDYNLIMGNVSKKADAMLASFHEYGGKKKIVQADENKVVIEFAIDGETYTGVCDWVKLQGEAFTRATKDANGKFCGNLPIEKRPYKDNYSTPVKRGQMLFARCVSDSLRRICPKACGGYYTPEEVSDFAPAEEKPAAPAAEVQPMPPKVEKQPPQPPAEPPKTEAKPVEPAAPTVQAEDNTNYDICRIPNVPTSGKAWRDMDTPLLELARDKVPISQYFTLRDRENIIRILDERSLPIPADN